MIRKILVAIDGSEHAWKALDLAIELAKAHQAELIVLHVLAHEAVPEALRTYAEVEGLPVEEESARFRYGRTLGDALTREAQDRARAGGVAAVEARTAEGKPATVIVETAKAERADMIVMGAYGRTRFRELILGGATHGILRQMTLPVLMSH